MIVGDMIQCINSSFLNCPPQINNKQGSIGAFCWQFSYGREYVNFTSRSVSLFQDTCRTRIMETYWCCKKNSIIDNYLKPDFTLPWCPALKNSVHGGKNGKIMAGVFLSEEEEDDCLRQSIKYLSA
jgi:hypothetical protein